MIELLDTNELMNPRKGKAKIRSTRPKALRETLRALNARTLRNYRIMRGERLR